MGEEAAPGVAGTGTTFTYYNDERFRDPHMLAPGTSAQLSDLKAEGTFSGDGIAWYETKRRLSLQPVSEGTFTTL